MTSDTPPDWAHLSAGLGAVEDLAARAVAFAGEEVRPDVYVAVLRSVAQFAIGASVDPSSPELTPSAGSVFNAACPNPDFVITTSPLTPDGVYRLSGSRGTTHFVTVTLRGTEVLEFDLDELHIAEDGTFSVLLSSEPSEDDDSDWRRLPAGASGIGIRQAAYMPGEIDGAFVIERLDAPVRPSVGNPDRRATQVTTATQMAPAYVGMWLDHVSGLADRGMINQLELDDWADRGGVEGQWYFQGIFELQPDEVLLLDTELPHPCRYWNVQLSDLLWNAIDPMRHQSSLNGAQARIGSDGRFRAVVSPDDPGIPNWLDTGGRTRGTVLGRWNQAASTPLPTATVVKATDLRDHLPADTPTVTPAEREESLRARMRAMQLRRRW